MRIVAFLILLAGPAYADCSISGRVSDQMGYVLPGAIVAAHLDGRVKAKDVSDSRGEFCIDVLGPARFNLTVTLAGFEKAISPVDLEGRPAKKDFVLQVAQVSNAVNVTAMRGDEREAAQLPQTSSVVTREDILRRPSRILPDVLREEAGVHVQQTTAGQGTPFLRGLMGNRVLVLVDGVRFNNSTFRLGPLQYMATIDPANVERVEIVKGPGSVLYGSDAMGGVINIIRKDRYYTPELQIHGRLMTQFASADLSTLGRAEVSITGPKAVAGISGTFQKFNNLRAGGGRYTHSAEARFVTNDTQGTQGRQAPTGFEQFGVDASARLKLNADQELSFVFQRFHQFDIPRYDQLAGGNGNLRYQFDPQVRDFFYAGYNRGALGFIDAFRANVSYQSQPETRLIQSISGGRSGDRVKDWSDTDTLGFSIQAIAAAGPSHTIAFGGEGYFDFVDSGIETRNDRTGATVTSRGRFPVDSRYRSYGVFIQDDMRLHDRLHLIAGGRGSLFQAKAPDIGVTGLLHSLNFADLPGIPTRLDYSAGDLTGTAGIVWTALPGLNFAFNAGRAFRAPNINDFGGVGLTLVRFELPAPDLKPESLVSYEFSTKLNLKRSFFSVSLFDSEIRDLIDRLPGTINGQSVVGGAQVLERTNFGRVRILGFESSAHIRFGGSLIWSNVAHTSGRNISSGDYLSFEGGMPPTQGWAGYKWEPSGRRYWGEAYAQFARKQDRISGIPLSMGGRFNGATPTADALDARIGAFRTRAQIESYRNFHGIPLNGGTLPGGQAVLPVSAIANTLMYREVPGFTTLNLRGGFKLSESASMTVLLENLFDRNYRVAGSGIDAPGFNLRLGYDVRF